MCLKYRRTTKYMKIRKYKRTLYTAYFFINKKLPFGIKHFLAQTLSTLMAFNPYRSLPEGISESRRTVRFLHSAATFFVGLGKLAWRAKLTNHPFSLSRHIQDLAGWIGKRLPTRYDGVTVRPSAFEGVPVVIFTPASGVTEDGYRPFIVYFHGGGWVMGNVGVMSGYLSRVARDTGAVVVAVDYRLAPDHPFPAPLDDALAVTRYLLGNGAALGLDVSRAAVMGDSAGGNLAAAVAAQLGGSASAGLKAQVLIYPVLGGPHSFQFKSFQLESPIVLTGELMAIFYLSYSGGQRHFQHINQLAAGNFSWDPVPPNVEKYLTKHRHYVDTGLEPGIRTELEEAGLFDQRVAPLLADDLSGVPQAFVATCEYDVLRDEGLAYVDRLNDAGVFVDHYHSPDGFHSMHTMIGCQPGPVLESAVKMHNATIQFINARVILTKT